MIAIILIRLGNRIFIMDVFTEESEWVVISFALVNRFMLRITLALFSFHLDSEFKLINLIVDPVQFDIQMDQLLIERFQLGFK